MLDAAFGELRPGIEGKMKTLLATAIFLLAPGIALGKTFVCDVNSTATFTTGTLKSLSNESYWLGLIETVTFDEDTGVFRYGSEGAWQQFTMKVQQRGTKSNDTVAVYSSNTLRIRGWEKGVPFVWDNGGDFFSGSCASYGD